MALVTMPRRNGRSTRPNRPARRNMHCRCDAACAPPLTECLGGGGRDPSGNPLLQARLSGRQGPKKPRHCGRCLWLGTINGQPGRRAVRFRRRGKQGGLAGASPLPIGTKLGRQKAPSFNDGKGILGSCNWLEAGSGLRSAALTLRWDDRSGWIGQLLAMRHGRIRWWHATGGG